MRALTTGSQSGAISAVLATCGGFAAGAVVVGLFAFGRPAPMDAGDGGQPASASRALPAADGPQAASTVLFAPPIPDPSPWNYESAAPQQAQGAPGRKRPDRFSGPEGWTYDPVR